MTLGMNSQIDARLKKQQVQFLENLPRVAGRLLHDPFSDVTRQRQRYLLIASIITLAGFEKVKCGYATVNRFVWRGPASPAFLHVWISNLYRMCSSAPEGSRSISRGVKNLRWHCSHSAKEGVLPTYFRTTRRRTDMRPFFHIRGLRS